MAIDCDNRCRLQALSTPPVDQFAQALFESDLWFPTQDALGLAAIEVGQVDIAGAFGCADNLRRVPGDLFQRVVEFVDRCASPCADTKDIVIAMIDGKHISPRHVFDVIGQCFSIAQEKMCGLWKADADITLEPSVGEFA